MTKKQQRNIIASIGTVLFMGLVILLLWLMQLTANKAAEKEYVEVVFEELEEQEEPEIPEVKPEPAPSREKDPGAASPAKSQPNNQPTKTTAEQIVSEEAQLAIVQQRIADSIAEANRQAKKKAEDLIGGFPFTATEDNGTAANKTQESRKGTSLKGAGSDGDNKWSLAGRGLVGTLPKPEKTFTQEGWAEIEISVDEKGNVIDASFKRGTISDNATRQLAIQAAKKAKFTADKNLKQVGTITYTFTFN